MKKLNALALCVAMVPAYVLGTSAVFAEEQNRDLEAQQESSMEDHKSSAEGDYSEEGSSTAEGDYSDEGDSEAMSADESEGADHTADAEMSEDTEPAFQANDLIGQSVTSRSSDETIGSINDLVFNESGQLLSVVVSVGGFLGIGEKDVAISWSDVERNRGPEGQDYVITVDSDAESLKNAEPYEGTANQEASADESK